MWYNSLIKLKLGGLIMKKIIAISVALFFLSPALAERVVIEVPGMVCQMCVQGMKKAFKDVVNNEDRDIVVNLKNKKVYLNLSKKIANVAISKRVKDAGYTAKSIRRSKRRR